MALLTQQTGTFEGYKLGTGSPSLRDLVLKGLRQTDTVRYSPTSGTADYEWIDDAMNRGQEEFVRRTKCLRTYAVVELKANYRTYRLPSDFLDLMSGYFYDGALSDGYKELIINTIEELNDEVSDWRTKTGSPTRVYVDRIYGNTWMFGLYPIPESDGDTITFSSDYGVVVEWVCPIYTYSQEYGVITRMTDTDEYFLNTDSGVVADVAVPDKNLWIEYYRLPMKLNNEEQYPEIPREYQKALPYYAVWDLLSDNPEDSNEYKRAMDFLGRFEREVKIYIDKRKRPFSGHNLRARPAVWTWMNQFEWHKAIP